MLQRCNTQIRTISFSGHTSPPLWHCLKKAIFPGNAQSSHPLTFNQLATSHQPIMNHWISVNSTKDQWRELGRLMPYHQQLSRTPWHDGTPNWAGQFGKLFLVFFHFYLLNTNGHIKAHLVTVNDRACLIQSRLTYTIARQQLPIWSTECACISSVCTVARTSSCRQ
jgi:hypothetical protein